MTCFRPAVVVAAIAMIVAPASGEARPRAKKPAGERVRLETEPAGATVYVGDKESGAAGMTPLDLELAAGEHVVILELEGYVPRFENVAVEDVESTQTFAYTLVPATAVLLIEAEAGASMPDGTRVLVDGVDQGELPARIEVEVGAHQVQVESPGREPYEDWVEVDGGEERLYTISAASLGAKVDTAPPRKKKKPRPGQAMAEARAGVLIGFRRFRYDGARSATARPYSASGTLHFTIDAELYPWRRFVANKVLDRLSLTAGAGYSPPIEATKTTGEMVDAFWRSQHAGLRFRAPIRPQLAIDIDAGWVHTLYTFLDRNGAFVADVPDVDYHAVSIGARVVGRLAPRGMVHVWLGADNRLMFKGGALETRFAGAKVDGVAGHAGAAVWLLDDRLVARLDADYARYGWTFQTQPDATFEADGGTDAIYGITLSVGGAY